MGKAAARPWGMGIGLAVLGLAAAVVVLGERVWLAAVTPLWLDETWTLAIISAPDAHGFWREVYLDVNAPLYYVLMRGWTGVLGVSDLALRAPGLILAPLAAALPLVIKPEGLPRGTRLGWAGLIFFWWGCGQFLDARCYALLLALCVIQAVLFARLIRGPSLGRALAWTAISAIAILCQYYALFITLAQGLVYLGVHRGRAIKTWPALIAFAPAAAWIAHHAPRLADYGRPDVAWHQTVDLGSSLSLAAFTLGGYPTMLSLAAVAILALARLPPILDTRDPSRFSPPLRAARGRWRAAERRDGGGAHNMPPPEPDVASERPLRRSATRCATSPVSLRETGEEKNPAYVQVALAGLLALALVLLSGVLKPTLTARYLIPETPSILLGAALCAGGGRRGAAALIGLVATYAAFALDPGAVLAKARAGAPYGTEASAGFLAAHHVSDLVFLWDHPATKIIDPGSLRRVGGVLLGRAGDAAQVIPLVAAPDEDANMALLAAAQGPRPGLLWIYDRTGRTAAHSHPPRIAQIDPRWDCRTYGDGVVGQIACVRAAASAPGRPNLP